MIIVAMCSILAYYCNFHDAFIQSPTGYMFHLLYYRSHHCDASVDWSILGIANLTNFVEPEMPHEITAVTRTFWISVIQVISNCLLVAVSASMLGSFHIWFKMSIFTISLSKASTKFYWLIKTRRWTYWAFFVPLSVVFLATQFIDMITGWFYSMDLFRSLVSCFTLIAIWLLPRLYFQSIDGTMTLLEITNRAESRWLIEQIDQSYRSFPPNVMLYVSLKGIAGVILNIVVLFFVCLTGWEVVDGNKRKSAIKFVVEDKKAAEPSTQSIPTTEL